MRKVIIRLILLIFGFILSIGVFAQQPPAPPADKGTSGNQSPAGGQQGVPIEPGTGVLLILAAAYGFKKIKDVRKIQDN